MKKLIYILICIAFATPLKAQWDQPKDRYFYNGGFNYTDLAQNIDNSFYYLAGGFMEQAASTVQECNLTFKPNDGITIMGAAIGVRRFTISGTAGNVTIKLMQADGANLCHNDSFAGNACGGSYVKKQPGTLLHQEIISLSNATLKSVQGMNSVSYAAFNFANGGVNYNSNNGPLYIVFDFSAVGDDTIGLAYGQPLLDNDIYLRKDSLCWRHNQNFDLLIMPLMKNDPYVITSKKINKCIAGDPNIPYSRFFERKYDNSVAVCSDDTLLIIPSARYGFGNLQAKQLNSTNLPLINITNTYPRDFCGDFMTYSESGYLATPGLSTQYSFNWPDSMYATTNMNISVNVNSVNYPTITTNQNLSVCPGSNQLNASVTGPPNSIVWRGATFSDTSSANPTFNAVSDTTLTITAKTNSGSCETTKSIQVSIKRPFNQPICMVTVDSTAMHNIVVWEKEPNSNVDTFFVYREITTNNYQKIASIAYNNVTEFADVTANPNQQAYRYRITVKDLCGNTGALESNNFHNTIHLQNQGNGNFNWNNYTIEGQPTVVASYNFWRDSLGDGNWRNIATVPGTQNTYTDGQFASLPNASYRVEVNWIGSKTCNPLLKRKAVYSSSLSNIIKQNGTGLINPLINAFNCYPNPADNELIINNTTTANLTVTIYNAIGEKVIDLPNLNTGNISIDISDLKSGLYYVKASQNNYTTTKKLTVVH